VADEVDFPIGTRVCFSKLGAARCPKMASRIGTVVKRSIVNKVRVRFDGLLMVHTIHRSYLEATVETEESG